MGKIISERFICTDSRFDITNLLKDPSLFHALTGSREGKYRGHGYPVSIQIKEIRENFEPRCVEVELRYDSRIGKRDINRMRGQINEYMQCKFPHYYDKPLIPQK